MSHVNNASIGIRHTGRLLIVRIQEYGSAIVDVGSSPHMTFVMVHISRVCLSVAFVNIYISHRKLGAPSPRPGLQADPTSSTARPL